MLFSTHFGSIIVLSVIFLRSELKFVGFYERNAICEQDMSMIICLYVYAIAFRYRFISF